MDKRFENKMTMLKTILSLLQLNESIWSDSAPLAAAIEELAGLIAQIEEIQQMTGEDNSGLSASKKLEKDALIKRAFELTSIIFAMATRNKDQVLLAKVDFPISDLMHLRESELATRSKNILELGRSNLPQITTFGTSEEKLNALDEQIAHYKLSIPARRVSVSELKAANKKLKELLKQAIELVTDQIDRMLVQFETINPDFYNAYLNARKVVDYGIRHEKPEDPENPDQNKD
jgi:hypothetical protein